jgi:hypothetical protein
MPSSPITGVNSVGLELCGVVAHPAQLALYSRMFCTSHKLLLGGALFAAHELDGSVFHRSLCKDVVRFAVFVRLIQPIGSRRRLHHRAQVKRDL